MDISQFQKLSKSKIEAGREIRSVRNELKEYKEAKQDAYEGLSETYKPLIDVQKNIQKNIQESVDKKQDELIEQLQKNQKAITSGLEDILLPQQLQLIMNRKKKMKRKKKIYRIYINRI